MPTINVPIPAGVLISKHVATYVLYVWCGDLKYPGLAGLFMLIELCCIRQYGLFKRWKLRQQLLELHILEELLHKGWEGICRSAC